MATVRRAIAIALLCACGATGACTKKQTRQTLASMAAAPVSRDDWWEPRRDPDPFRPLGAEITTNPYADKEALFQTTPEQQDAMNGLMPLAAAIAIFLATGEVPALIFTGPVPNP